MRILDNLEVILTPWVWIRPYRYSREWDIELKELLERETFTIPPNDYVPTKLGKFPIAMYYFTNMALDVCPSRKTILLARRKYEKDIIKQIKQSDK